MKKGMVKGVFTSVAHNYDVMNDLMSAGEYLGVHDAPPGAVRAR